MDMSYDKERLGSYNHLMENAFDANIILIISIIKMNLWIRKAL